VLEAALLQELVNEMTCGNDKVTSDVYKKRPDASDKYDTGISSTFDLLFIGIHYSVKCRIKV